MTTKKYVVKMGAVARECLMVFCAAKLSNSFFGKNFEAMVDHAKVATAAYFQ